MCNVCVCVCVCVCVLNICWSQKENYMQWGQSTMWHLKFGNEPKAGTRIKNNNALWLKAFLTMILGLRPKLKSGRRKCGPRISSGLSTVIHFFWLLINLFIYFWLLWVFVAVSGLSLVAASEGYSSVRCAGFSLRWLVLLRSTGSRHAGFSSWGTRAQ